jgi:PAT family beta-lactamase induction signal transducer AmpG
VAFSSATHDTAADGFYMLALNDGDQAQFVGIRSTFFRCAVIFGQGGLVILAGFLESATGLTPLRIDIDASPQHTQTMMAMPSHNFVAQDGELRFLTSTDVLQINTENVHQDSASAILAKVNAHNIAHGFAIAEEVVADEDETASWMSRTIGQPFGNWIARNFGPGEEVVAADDGMVGNIGIVAVQLSQNPAETRRGYVVLYTAMRRGGDVALVSDERLIFTEDNWNVPAYMAFQLDRRLTTEREAEFRGLSGNIRFAWSTTFFILAGLLVAGALWHKFILPTPDSDKPAADVTASTVFKEFIETFASFFRKPGIGVALFFMLTYRFAEAQLLALITPFLLDSRELGGLGMTTSEVGMAYGVFGIAALTLGGIVGGIVASRGGLKKWLWPMTLALLLPSYAFVHLSLFQPENFFVISSWVVFEQFGYGFGFVAYMLFMIYFSEGKNKTAHYAICTGFMALGMMIPRMWSGWLQELIGYESFFWWVMICSIIPIIAVALLKIDPEFGKKTKK